MREIGVRELKANLSAALREISRGGRLRVTVRGQPVADIVPVLEDPKDDPLRRLIAEGRVVPASRPRPKRPPQPAVASRSATAIVLEERDSER